jgi:hypothetical protein
MPPSNLYSCRKNKYASGKERGNKGIVIAVGSWPTCMRLVIIWRDIVVIQAEFKSLIPFRFHGPTK